MSDRSESEAKKVYSPPKIVYTEKVEARAVTCQMSDSVACSDGPLQS